MKAVSYILFLIIFCSCSTKIKDPKKLNRMFEKYWDERSAFFPLEATQQGDYRYNNIITNDQTQDFRNKLQKFYKKYFDYAQKFDFKSLNNQDQLSLKIFKYELNSQLKSSQYDYWKIPFQQFWGLPLTLPQLGAGTSYQPFKTKKDYEDWVGRVKGFKVWSDSAINNFNEGVKSGVVLPEILVQRMIPQLEAIIKKDFEKSIFYSPIKNLPKSFSDSDRKDLSALYKKMILEEINPTYQKWVNYLKNDYLPHARKTHGISSLPQGEDMYLDLVKGWTTTSLTPDQIYEVGQNEVARITKEMEGIKNQVGFWGDLKSFFTHVRNDPKLMPFKSEKEILNAFRNIQKTIMPRLSAMFGKVPKTPFEIRQTEDFRAESSSAEYSQGSPDGSRPGIFYIPILNPKKFNITSGMESLFLHEAIPGHHYQISLQQENESLPKFRRFSWYGAYGEGWALYTESLGKDLGLYINPYQYLGALGDEMHRALRLVVDVGIHMKGMSRDEAIKYLMDHEPISYEGAQAEVERYMAIPGQALSYKVGSLNIAKLKNHFQKKLKDKFSISSFHDEVLSDGCMPLAVLNWKLNRWYKKQKESK